MEQLKKLRNLPVSTLMTRDVVTVKGSQTVATAIEIMKKHKVSSLLVEPRNSEDTYGIITEKDILEKVIDPGNEVHKDPWNTQIHTVMSKPLVHIEHDLRVKYAIRLMRRIGIRRAPVMQNGKMIGMISHTDILHAVENLSGSDEVAL